MSSRIVFSAHAIRYPVEVLTECEGGRDGLIYEDQFLLLELGGQSNVIDRNNRVARDWSAVGVGMQWQVMQQVVQLAASCEGGCLRWLGRDTKAETYIGAQRRVVSNATLFSDQYVLPRSLTARLCLHMSTIEEMNSYSRERLDTLAGIRTPQQAKPTYVDGADCEWTSWTFDLLAPGDFTLWLVYRTLDPARVWDQVMVQGWHDRKQNQQLSIFG